MHASTPVLNDHSLDTEGGRAIVPVMPLTPEQLLEEAMDLPAQSRARLADLLVESLGTADLGAFDRAWAAEARKRRDEVRSGAVTSIPAGDAFKKAKASLKR